MKMFDRHRRLRGVAGLRDLVREHLVRVDDLILPVFAMHGGGREAIASMPGVEHLSLEELRRETVRVSELGIPALLLFGLPANKDERSSEAYAKEGIVQQAVRAVKQENPDLVVITDVCLCQYNPAGHCGLVKDGRIVNDESLELIAQTALSHAAAGADVVAPSDMMDGRVAAIRDVLDRAGFSHIPVMSYAVKYASAFYGPFREAAHSAPAFGDRRTYQMDPANVREALREARSDAAEGADVLMVKPAMPYLDVVRAVREAFDLPVAVYNVSGEYAMIKAAAQVGWIDERAVVMELMTGFKRAGADMILTYFAKDVAKYVREL